MGDTNPENDSEAEFDERKGLLENEEDGLESDEMGTDTEQLFTDEEEVEEDMEPAELPQDNDSKAENENSLENSDETKNAAETEQSPPDSYALDDDGYGEIEFIKHPIKEQEWDLDELVAEIDVDDEPSNKSRKSTEAASSPSIHISKMQINSYKHAAEIAEEIILVLEQDVVTYFKNAGMAVEELNSSGETDPDEIAPRDKISGSSLSVASDASLPLPGEPSTLRLFYEKGENITREDQIPPLEGVGIDEMCEVVLHRSRKWKRRGKPAQVDGFAQTKTMTFIPEDKSGMAFMKIYPEPDDYVRPELPSRKTSMNLALTEAEKENPRVDTVLQPNKSLPKITGLSNRKKILPPLRDDYYKDETFWTGSRFKGEYKNRQFHKGHYDHPTGVQYESEWLDGHFHTSKHFGIMEYPRGDTFEGEWSNGRYVSGEITFGDGLKYSSTNWSYCELPDRRLRAERYYGMKPAGDTIYNDQYPTQKLPPGCYDVGEGIYNPKNGEVHGYDGFFMRKANHVEHNWIIRNCRKQLTHEEEYIPSFNSERIPGTYTEQVQRFTIAKRRFH